MAWVQNVIRLLIKTVFRAHLKCTMTLIHCIYSIYCITCRSDKVIHHENNKHTSDPVTACIETVLLVALFTFSRHESKTKRQKRQKRKSKSPSCLESFVRMASDTPRQSRHTRTGRAVERRSNICSFVPAEDYVFAKQL